MSKEKSLAKIDRQMFHRLAWQTHSAGDHYAELTDAYNEFRREHGLDEVQESTVKQKVAQWAKKGIAMPKFEPLGTPGGGNKINVEDFDMSVVPAGAETYQYKAKGPRKPKEASTEELAEIVS